MLEPVIVGAVRTPFGRRDGLFRSTRSDELLALALKAILQRTGLPATKVDDVITGCVTQSGEQGCNIGRQGALFAGLPVEVPAVSLNRLCGSSQQAVHFAAQAIAAGDATYILAAGVESMTRVAMSSDVGDAGWNAVTTDRYGLVHQGESAELVADKWKITRKDVDEFAAESHRRAARAAEGRLNAEIFAAPGLDKEGKQVLAETDEGIRPKVDMGKMATLPTIFRPNGNGVVTAGNSSQISDGAAAALIAERSVAEADGLRPRARFKARVVVGDDPRLQLAGVIPATRLALKKAGLSLKDLDWLEINEAFATVPLAWARELGIDLAKVNPWGGACAHGHPLGASGASLVAKTIAGLEKTGGTFGLVTMCIGHGMATATILERI